MHTDFRPLLTLEPLNGINSRIWHKNTKRQRWGTPPPPNSSVLHSEHAVRQKMTFRPEPSSEYFSQDLSRPFCNKGTWTVCAYCKTRAQTGACGSLVLQLWSVCRTLGFKSSSGCAYGTLGQSPHLSSSPIFISFFRSANVCLSHTACLYCTGNIILTCNA